MTVITRRRSLGLIAGAVAAPALARAQGAWSPSRTITMVVPYPAGGPTDAIGRIVAKELEAILKVSVVVDNRAGASGAIGTRSVARGDADGHLIIFGNNQTHGSNQFLLREPGYDPQKDFAPLAGVGSFEHVFVVRKDLPAKDIPELVALAKKDPGKLNYGSTGVGSGSHLFTELFMTRTGTQMTHVPFRGAAPLVQELMGGRIDIANSTLPSVLGQIQSGDLRAIALASPARNMAVPNVPTLREQGIANADADSWAAFFAPAATPVPALSRLSQEIVTILNGNSAREAILRTGFTMNVRDPAAFRPYHAQEITVLRDVIAAANIKPVE
ncbi:MAG: tripartite tricarboxylate transporter substrate binding protein [Bosea sp.]|jgi:tripartite-type tricarboxylate transporter receptor subunit TctC|nr:tripartite tricarboxylate transporter substrate binding protein [Bosea sp. (in: a-proteobacteria)]